MISSSLGQNRKRWNSPDKLIPVNSNLTTFISRQTKQVCIRSSDELEKKKKELR